MLRKMLRLSGRSMVAGNENTHDAETEAHPENVRALATGAALAASVDASPAVLVSIYDYAHRYRDRPYKRTG